MVSVPVVTAPRAATLATDPSVFDLENGTLTRWSATAPATVEFFNGASDRYNLAPVTPSVDITDLFRAGGSGVLYEFTIPNFVDPLPLKVLKVNATFTRVGVESKPLPTVLSVGGVDNPGPFANPPDPDAVSVPVPGIFVSLSATDSSFHELWHIYPNPDWETVAVFVPPIFTLDTLGIVTQSVVPLPPAILLLFTGGVACVVFGRWT